MMAHFVERDISGVLSELAEGFPVVVITGPRQSGKTTLAKRFFSGKPYVSLENPIEREFFQEDPLGFLARFPDGAVFDEVQNTPDLMSYLQGIVDEDGRMGLYVLTGSQNFALSDIISQSLAGRAGIAELLPFSHTELERGGYVAETLEEQLLKGAYPPVHDRGLNPSTWYKSYVRTYLERDVRSIVNVRNLGAFQDFLSVCATCCGSQVNLSKLASDCKIDSKTAKIWLGVLEASYIVRILRPYFKNFRKRITKSPKLYFWDTGLLCHLLKMGDEASLSNFASRGALFENWVISELSKQRLNRGDIDNLFFWREQEGVEVDVLLDLGDKIEPVEIKSGMTPQVKYARHLNKFVDWAGDAASNPKIIYTGRDRLTIRGVEYLPWKYYLSNT